MWPGIKKPEPSRAPAQPAGAARTPAATTIAPINSGERKGRALGVVGVPGHHESAPTDAVREQTTERGREHRARQLAQRGTVTGLSARIGRARTFEIRGSDAVRVRDAHLNLSGEQAAALALAQDEGQVGAVIGQALADYFNSGAGYAGFGPQDFSFGPDEFDLR